MVIHSMGLPRNTSLQPHRTSLWPPTMILLPRPPQSRRVDGRHHPRSGSLRFRVHVYADFSNLRSTPLSNRVGVINSPAVSSGASGETLPQGCCLVKKKKKRRKKERRGGEELIHVRVWSGEGSCSQAPALHNLPDSASFSDLCSARTLSCLGCLDRDMGCVMYSPSIVVKMTSKKEKKGENTENSPNLLQLIDAIKEGCTVFFLKAPTIFADAAIIIMSDA